jgi:hypothetical protein
MKRLAAAAIGTLLSGCAVVSNLPRPLPRGTGAVTPIPDDGYQDVVGVIHVHTTYSHDAHGTLADVVRVANAQALDYVVLTEHNNLRALYDGHQGWHGATLLVVGVELSTAGGHYLALNVTREIDPRGRTAQQVIDEVNRQGGFGFIAHPYFKKRRWTDWSVSGFTGIEAYNVAHDTLDENRMRLILWTLTATPTTFYHSLIDRPYDALRTWDQLITRHGRVTGIGSTDAHQIEILGVKFAPYEMMFQLIRTHLLVPSLPLTPEAVYAALRAGHAYAAIELEAQAQGFGFLAAQDTRVVGVMGDEVALGPDLRLAVSVPAPAEMALFRDGARIAVSVGRTWEIPVTQSGVYRIEALRHGKPWVFSNPIYVRPPATPAP